MARKILPSKCSPSLVVCLQAVQLIGLLLSNQVALAASKSVQIIDQNDPLDIESVAKAVCETTRGKPAQIGRVSTIAKLVDYFDNQITDNQHKLFECKQQHGDALHLLQELLTSSNANVCSDTKLDLIEAFHTRFVSTHVDDLSNRSDNSKDAAPLLLRLFFMHYAMEVDSVCKRNLINNLEWDLKEKFGDNVSDKLLELQDNESNQAAFKAVFAGAMEKFTTLFSVKKFDDVVVIWDLMHHSYLLQKLDDEHQYSIRDEYDPITREPIRIQVKVKRAHYLNLIKHQCHYSFKPIYSALILPIMRLANLGYSNSGEQFKVELEELRQNENVKRWYSVTQLCESMLPVKFYEDPAMKEDAVVVITKDEAAELDKHEREKEPANSASGEGAELQQNYIEYEPETNSMLGVDLLQSIASREAQKLVGRVKTNVNAQDRIFRRTIVHMLHYLKHALASSSVGRFFFSRKSNKKSDKAPAKYVQEDVGKKFGLALETCSEEELLKLEGSAFQEERFGRAKPNAKGIGARRTRHRQSDDNARLSMRMQAISKPHVMSWSEIFGGWTEVLSALAPTRIQLLLAGGALIGMLFLVSCVVLFAFFHAG